MVLFNLTHSFTAGVWFFFILYVNNLLFFFPLTSKCWVIHGNVFFHNFFFLSCNLFQVWNISQQAKKLTSFSHSMTLEYLAKGPKTLKRNKETNNNKKNLIHDPVFPCHTQFAFSCLKHITEILMSWCFIFIRKISLFCSIFHYF